MNRLVNIFMIFILVSCPVRCMMQGCGCYQSDETCCQTTTSVDVSAHSCCSKVVTDCCRQKDASDQVPTAPTKCQCNCFCGGALVADIFVLQHLDSSCLLFGVVDSQSIDALFRRLVFEASLHPPDALAVVDKCATNPGRQIRCRINSLLI